MSTSPASTTNTPATAAAAASTTSPQGSNYASAESPVQPLLFGQVRVKLSESIQESRRHDRLADLYALLVLLEQLEVLYVRDAVSADEYHSECTKLIAQYRTWMSSNSAELPEGSVEEFTKDMGMRCDAALTRIRAGIPATLQHVGAMRQAGGDDGSGSKRSGHNRPIILAIGERFITAMDSLKLNMRAADELYPLANDVLEQLARFAELPADHDSKTRVARWVSTLVHMSAADQLTDEQARQMYFDLETAYNGFRTFLMDQT